MTFSDLESCCNGKGWLYSSHNVTVQVLDIGNRCYMAEALIADDTWVQRFAGLPEEAFDELARVCPWLALIPGRVP